MNPIPSLNQPCCDGCRFDHAPLLDAFIVSKQMIENPNVLSTYLERGGNPNAEVWANLKSIDSLRDHIVRASLLKTAVHYDKIDLVKLLIQYKAEAPQDIHCNSAEVFELLADTDVEIPSFAICFYTRLEGSDSQLIRRLADKGADINYRLGTDTVLTTLAQANKPKPLKAMIEAGADISVVGFGNRTALDQALINKMKECAIPLILHNAPFNQAYADDVAKLFRGPLQHRELHGRFPPHMRRPVDTPFPINPFIQNCED